MTDYDLLLSALNHIGARYNGCGPLHNYATSPPHAGKSIRFGSIDFLFYKEGGFIGHEARVTSSSIEFVPPVKPKRKG